MYYTLKGYVEYKLKGDGPSYYYALAWFPTRPPLQEALKEVVKLADYNDVATLLLVYNPEVEEGVAQWLDVEHYSDVDIFCEKAEEEGRRCGAHYYLLIASTSPVGVARSGFAEAVFIPGRLVHGLVLAAPAPDCRCLVRLALVANTPGARVALNFSKAEPSLKNTLDVLEWAGYDVSRDRAVLKSLRDPHWDEWAEERCKELAKESVSHVETLEFVGGRPTIVYEEVSKEAARRFAEADFKHCPKWRDAALERL